MVYRMEALTPDTSDVTLDAILNGIDARLLPRCKRAFQEAMQAPTPPEVRRQGRVVLVGHRASGKTRMLPWMGRLLGLPTVDLDKELERQSGRKLRDWVTEDEPGFRKAERALFLSRPDSEVEAAGGGFLSLHADLLEGHTPVLIPVTFETYRKRLMADKRRPRLRPELSLEEELRQVFEAREAAHARVKTVSLVDFVAWWCHPARSPR